MALREQTYHVNNAPVRCWLAGEPESRPVMLLHGGMGAAHLHWAASMPLLAEEFYVIAPDLPGFGDSAALRRLSIANLIEWINQLMDVLGQEQMALVGNDFGALLARLYSAAHPQRIPALVLVNGGSLPNIPPALRLLAQTPLVGSLVFNLLARSTLAPAELEGIFHGDDARDPAFLAQIRQHIPAFARMMRLLTASTLPEATTPSVATLLLWGSEDTLSTPDEAKRIQRQITGAFLETIADCGHMPQVEATEVFAWQVAQFLNNPTRNTKPGLPGVGRLR